MPEPIMVPVAHLIFFGRRDASWRHRAPGAAAAIPKMMKSSTLRWSFGSIHWSGLKVPSLPSPRGTAQAIWLGKIGDFEVLDPPGAALAVEDTLPRCLNATAEWRNHAQTRDDNPPHIRNLQLEIFTANNKKPGDRLTTARPASVSTPPRERQLFRVLLEKLRWRRRRSRSSRRHHPEFRSRTLLQMPSQARRCRDFQAPGHR